MARPRAGGKRPGAGRPSVSRIVREVGVKNKQDRLAKIITDDDVQMALGKLRELAQGVFVTEKGWMAKYAKAFEAKDPLKVKLLQDLAQEQGYFLVPVACGVYREKPDRQAAQYLVDQKHGLPMARQQLSGSLAGGLSVRLYMPEKTKK